MDFNLSCVHKSVGSKLAICACAKPQIVFILVWGVVNIKIHLHFTVTLFLCTK